MRRGHGSTKVPNVKLRPVQKTRSVNQASIASVTTDEPEVEGKELELKKPLTGLVLSASGIRDKSNILRKASQLGAKTMPDLTDQVTHLICDTVGSAKYKYCVKNFVPIMKSTWILDLFSKWVEGDDIDLNSSLAEHRLPAFTSVTLCISGIEDREQRESIQRILSLGGGRYIRNIEGEAVLTHLLCGSSRGEVDERGWTAKMQHVDKLNAKRTDKIAMVWDTWFFDCAHVGGLLDENDYSILRPRPQSRVPQRKQRASTETLTRSPRRNLPPSLPDNVLTSTEDTEELAIVKRVPEATARLWHSLVKPRGFDMKYGKLVRSPTKSAAASTSEKITRESPVVATEASTGSRIAAFRRTKSFAPYEMPPVAGPSRAPTTLKDLSIQSSVFSTTNTLSRSSALNPYTSSFLAPVGEHTIPDGERNLFVGKVFAALGEACGPRLDEEIRLRGGTVTTEKEEADYIIVRIVSGSKFCWEEMDERIREKFRTECWLEQCIHKERVCDPDEHITFTPLRIHNAVPGVDKLNVHLSGLDAFERTSSVRLLKAIGIPYSEHFSRKNTHLLCPSGIGLKVQKAREWGIPIVNMQWLHAIAFKGVLEDVEKYVIPSQDVPGEEACSDGKMVDITNNDGLESLIPVVTYQKNGIDTEIPDTPVTPVTPRAAEKRRTQNPVDLDDGPTVTGTFGEPVSGLLCNTPRQNAPRLPHKSNSLPVLDHGVDPCSPLKRRSHSDKNMFSGDDPLKTPTRIETDPELDNRIPSSNSPSPLKGPRSTKTASPVLRENANLLKDAIASLLGKREIVDEEDVGLSRSSSRGVKRARPQLQKEALSPVSSDVPVSAYSPVDLPASQLPPNSQLPPATGPRTSLSTRDSRVTYEDPAQRVGQQKLKALLTGKPELQIECSGDTEMVGTDRDDEVQIDEPAQAKVRATRGRKAKGKGKATVN